MKLTLEEVYAKHGLPFYFETKSFRGIAVSIDSDGWFQYVTTDETLWIVGPFLNVDYHEPLTLEPPPMVCKCPDLLSGHYRECGWKKD